MTKMFVWESSKEKCLLCHRHLLNTYTNLRYKSYTCNFYKGSLYKWGKWIKKNQCLLSWALKIGAITINITICEK